MGSLDWSTLLPNLPYLLQGMWITLKITLCAIFFGLLWGTVLAIMTQSTIVPLRYFAKIYIALFRSIPLLLVLMWFYLIIPTLLHYLFNITPTTDIRFIAAIVAFSLFEAAYYSEIIRAGINQVRIGQKYAAFAIGLNRYQTLRYILLPQAFQMMIPLLLTQAIILFQDTSLVYALSLADFFRSSVNIGQTSGTEVEMVLFSGACYFILCLMASICVTKIKKRRFL